MDMLDEAVYEGNMVIFWRLWLRSLCTQSNWDVLEISDEDAVDGVMFQAQDPDSEASSIIAMFMLKSSKRMKTCSKSNVRTV